ncbi:HesA/MoeB/ThiF family protein [Streptomyces calvus]|nr:molybdopterin/thiamine biosynthesis adenylyltransferase [Streptomyces calvus]
MRRPRVKPEHRAYRTVDGHVRIGSVVHGIGAEVKDPDGWVWTLVEAMDGTRTGADVVAEVSRRHPHLRLPAEDIVQAMTDLTAAGYVEDAGAVPPPELSERERERYGRGMTLMRWMDLQPRQNPWEPQLRLRRARVLLVGVGGTGGAAARDLVASGVGRLHCVEPDVVELSNLNRQTLYREQDLGTPKIDAALRALRALNPHTTVTGERREVRGPADLEDLLTGTHGNLGPATSGNLGPATSGNLGPATSDGFGPSASGRPASGGSGTSVRGGSVAGPRYDVLLLAADRPAAIRRWANQVCLATGTPWAEAGYRGPLVSVGMFRPGRSACWVCLRDAEAERRDLRLAPGQDEDVASPRMPWNPVNAVTAGLSGSLLAHAALALLCDVPRMDAGCRFGLNLMMPGDPVMQRTPRRPHCPACGTKPSTKRAVPAPEPAAPAPEPAVPAPDPDTTAPVPEPAVPAAEPAAPAPDPNMTAPVPEPAVPAADSDTTAPVPELAVPAADSDTTAPAPDTTAPAPASAPPPPSGGVSS